jgi:YegS/Rv2252/BmrU family lipid kinase
VKQALIITNPMASRADERGLTDARRRLQEGGLAVELVRTTAPGHAERLATAAVREGVELLVAHGGDGTVMEVAAALVGTGRPLGLLPAGTGNLLAGNLGVRRTPRAAADVILRGHVRPIDVGRLSTTAGTRYFAVAAGMGFDAELMHRTPHGSKRTFGVGAYVATAVGLATTITRATLRIETERVTLEAPAATVLIANCRELIPGVLPLAERGIEPDDGVLNVVVLDARSLPSAARVAWRLLLRQGASDPGVTYLGARHVHVSADRDLPVQADGEACGRSPLTVEVVPRGLAVLAPPRGRP